MENQYVKSINCGDVYVNDMGVTYVVAKPGYFLGLQTMATCQNYNGMLKSSLFADYVEYIDYDRAVDRSKQLTRDVLLRQIRMGTQRQVGNISDYQSVVDGFKEELENNNADYHNYEYYYTVSPGVGMIQRPVVIPETAVPSYSDPDTDCVLQEYDEHNSTSDGDIFDYVNDPPEYSDIEDCCPDATYSHYRGVGCDGVDLKVDDIVQLRYVKASVLVDDELAKVYADKVFPGGMDYTDPMKYGHCYMLMYIPAFRKNFFFNNMPHPRILTYEHWKFLDGVVRREDFVDHVGFVLKHDSNLVHIYPYVNGKCRGMKVDAYKFWKTLGELLQFKTTDEVKWSDKYFRFVKISDTNVLAHDVEHLVVNFFKEIDRNKGVEARPTSVCAHDSGAEVRFDHHLLKSVVDFSPTRIRELSVFLDLLLHDHKCLMVPGLKTHVNAVIDRLSQRHFDHSFNKSFSKMLNVVVNASEAHGSFLRIKQNNPLPWLFV